MRILLIADLHYSLPQFDWVLANAQDFDVVVLAGDHLDIASMVDGRAQSIVVKKYFGRLREKTRLLICSGNHDLDSKNEAGEKVARWLLGEQNLGLLSDGESVREGDTLFTLCPWWDGPVSRDELSRQLAEASEQRGKYWIWVHHAPPAQSPISWAGSRYFGDEELRQWIEQYQPDIVMAGHVHESPFVTDGSWVDRIGKTWVFNGGRQPGEIPTHIVIDTEIGEAVWFSATSSQLVRLGEPLVRPVAKLEAIPDWVRASGQPRAQAPG